jgi:hypothetical protein
MFYSLKIHVLQFRDIAFYTKNTDWPFLFDIMIPINYQSYLQIIS